MFGRHPRFQLVGSLFALIIALAIGFLPAAAQQPAPAQVLQTTFPFYQDAAIAKAVSYLRTQQLPSGAIDSFTFGADPGGTSRLLLALNAVGYSPATFVKEGKSLLDYLESELVNYIYANDTPGPQNLFPGRAGLVLGAVAAGGADPRNFGGIDLIAELSRSYNESDGTYSTTASEQFASGAASPINQTLAIIGLVAAGQPIPERATQWLIDKQGADGSWSNSVDVTGYGVVALIGSGNVPPTDPAIQKALAFYRASQTLTTALWGDAGSGEPANSTGWTMTALSTYGYAPMADSWATGGTNPRQALIGLQTDEGVIAKRFFNAYATLEALYGLSDQPIFMATPLRVERALAFIKSRQNADGGWPGFTPGVSSPGETLDNLFAFVAAGYDPTAVRSSAGNGPLDYLSGAAASYTRNSTGIILPARSGKLIVGVVAAGGNPRSFGTPSPLDLVSDLQSTYNPATGTFSTTASPAGVTNQSFAILGLRAAGEPVPQAAIDYLAGLQAPNGSWGSVFATGLALQALIAAGVAPTDQVIRDAVDYLRTSQAASGGWEDFGSFSPNSTAYAIQGLQAAGVDLNASDWLKSGRSPLGTLASYQKTDGPFVFGWEPPFADDSLFTTQQAVPALLGATYPYTPTGALRSTYTPLKRGPDPDRLVVAPPYITFNADRTQAILTAPFGSDLDGDATAILEWSIESGQGQPAAFQTITATRGSGYFRATLDLSANRLRPTDTLVLRATFTDPDGVQSGGTISSEPVPVTGRAEPNRRYLPFVAR